jgi:hypothetical protein
MQSVSAVIDPAWATYRAQHLTSVVKFHQTGTGSAPQFGFFVESYPKKITSVLVLFLIRTGAVTQSEPTFSETVRV